MIHTQFTTDSDDKERINMGLELALNILSFTRIIVLFFGRTLILKILYILCPPLFRRFYDNWRKDINIVNPGFDVHEFARVNASFTRMLVPITNVYRRIFYVEAEEGGRAPNPRVLTADGKTEVRLLDSARLGVPLVLNFGNIT